MANTKLNGQIWISRTEPYNLKYRYNNKNYIVSVVENFDYDSDSGIKTGSVIAIDSSGIRKAVFPDDLDKVVGLAYVKENQIFLINKGEITVDKSAFKENIDPAEGDPVFWYIGKTGISYDSSDYGKLTALQPNEKKPADSIIDNTLDIGYDNLPQIGTVKSIDSDNIVITIIPPVFDSSLEWHWPKEEFSVILNDTPFEMKHGLLVDSSKCFSTCEILSKDTSGYEYRSFADITQKYDNGSSHSKSTTIKVHSLIGHSYKVSGTVYYNK